MWGLAIALGAGALALLAGREKSAAAGGGKKTPPKSEQDIFADGEKAGRAKAEGEYAAKRAEEKKIAAMVRRQMATGRVRRRPAPDEDDAPEPESN